jgi:hypothetical protein
VSACATVILAHTTGDDRHYDWMFEPPDRVDDQAKLVTFRIDLPSAAWADARRFDLVHIGDHRRLYLTYEGELSGGRGSVRRVDAGRLTAVRWDARDGGVLDVELRHFAGRLALRRVDGDRWHAARLDQA